MDRHREYLTCRTAVVEPWAGEAPAEPSLAASGNAGRCGLLVFDGWPVQQTRMPALVLSASVLKKCSNRF